MSNSVDRAVPRRHWLEAWHVNPSSNIDFQLIDGLRGIAILMVVAGHYFYINPEAGPLVKFFGSLAGEGGAGVIVFFAISGFVISLPFWNRKVREDQSIVPRGYAWRRFWKIYPPLAASVIFFTPIYILRSHDWSYIWLALQWLAGIAFFIPVSGKLNPVMWSLVVEVQFYITLPFIFIFLRNVPARHCLWVLTSLLLLIPNLFRLLLFGHGPAFHPWINSYFPTGLDTFAFGTLVAGMQSMGLIRRSWVKLANLGVMLFLLTLFAMAYREMQTVNVIWNEFLRWTLLVAVGLMLCYIADPNYRASKWLSMAPLRWFGIVSYELYLVHQPLVLWMRGFFGPCSGQASKYLALLGGTFLASVVIAALFYKLFSLPILKRGRGKSV